VGRVMQGLKTRKCCSLATDSRRPCLPRSCVCDFAGHCRAPRPLQGRPSETVRHQTKGWGACKAGSTVTPPMMQSVADMWSRPVARCLSEPGRAEVQWLAWKWLLSTATTTRFSVRMYVAPGQAIASRRRKSTLSARCPSWCASFGVWTEGMHSQPCSLISVRLTECCGSAARARWPFL
jgi:hypothetical protein